MTEILSLDDLEKRLNSRPWRLKKWHSIKYRVLNLFDIKYKIRRLKWVCQRAKRGYSDCDIWGMHYYLLEIIPPMLEYLKYGAGYPCSKEIKTMEDWQAKIDEMLDGFYAARRIEEFKYGEDWKTPYNEDWKKFKKGMREFTKYFFALWD